MPGRYFDLVELLEAHLSHLSEQPGSDQFHAILMNPAEVPLIELIRFKTFTRSNPWNEPPHDDSGGSRPPFRDDAARHSGMMPPTIPF